MDTQNYCTFTHISVCVFCLNTLLCTHLCVFFVSECAPALFFFFYSKLAAFNSIGASAASQAASQPHLLSPPRTPFCSPSPLVNTSRCLVGFLDLREMRTAPRNSRRKRPRNAPHRVS